MLTTYTEALEWIHGRLRLGIKPGLKRMEWMMERVGSPEKKLKAIHVGGTNGKGSTVTFLRSIYQANGYKVGTFTSPYIEHFNERISINGKPIGDQELIDLVNIIRPLANELEETDLGGPTEFEVITAMAFYYFAEVHPVNIVLFEVGLGGRFDSTNILQPIAAVITNIGLDHTNILGNSHEEIAFEKAGIIKDFIPVFTAVKQEGALKVIEEQAKQKKAPIFRLGQDFSIDFHQSLPKGENFNLKNNFQSLEKLETQMLGKHQTENAALAVVTAQYLHNQGEVSVSEQAIRDGLRLAYWPGRFEVLSHSPLVIIDGAHNDEGVSKLVDELLNRFPSHTIHVVFAALKDKKLENMITRLDQAADRISFLSFDFPRAASAQDLLELSTSNNKQAIEDWETFLFEEITGLSENDLLVITGSLYFISEVKPHLNRILSKYIF